MDTKQRDEEAQVKNRTSINNDPQLECNEYINFDILAVEESNVTYYCKGKRICPTSICGLVTAYVLILIPSGLFYGVIIPHFDSSTSQIIVYVISVITLILDLYTLYDVSSTSPGYLSKGNVSKDDFFDNPGTILIKDMEIEFKYCETCKIRRELRSFHCNICGRCVRKHGKHIYALIDYFCI